jgi:hypothetical protein
MKKVIVDFESKILSEVDLNIALDLARQYGNLLWFADIGIYDAPSIEQSLIDRAVLYFKNHNFEFVGHDSSYVHIISEPLLIGGHTRLMEKLASMHDEPVDLIISRGSSKRAEERVSRFFLKTYKVLSIRPLDIVGELVAALSLYGKIVLHIHPDDILAVVACGVIKNISGAEVFFVNHADHVFSYGTYVADYYFELSSYGKRLDSKKLIAGKKSFLGIPVSMNMVGDDLDFMPDRDQPLVFISAGADIKYKPLKGVNILKLISRVLDVYSSSIFLVIGSNIKTSFWFWGLKFKYRSRFRVQSHLEFEEYSKIVASADFYVDSHPIPGGTAFAEQYLSARRCVGLVSPIQGYSPADRLKRNTVDEVMVSISNYRHSESTLEAIITVNGIENVKKRYLACVSRGEVCENLLDTYTVWTGDTTFFAAETAPANVDISLSNFFSIYKRDKVIAFRLFCTLSFRRKMKMMVKMAVFVLTARKRVVRSGKNG